jgi:hypothetical protein
MRHSYQADGLCTSFRRARTSRIALPLLLVIPLTMQGCLGVVWLGAVGVDSTRTSNIEFQSFENSWVAGPHERQHLALVRTVMVRPFAGDPVMAERWTTVFQELSIRRNNAEGHAITVQREGTISHINCVLTGDVAVQNPERGFAGLKETSSQRLYLRLMTDSGVLLWRSELPYTVVRGAKILDEPMVTAALLTHVRAHQNTIGLIGLGSITVALKNVEQPIEQLRD